VATRTVRDGEMSRESLLDAAEDLFAEQGVLGTSIRSVNKAAGLGPAAVHYHFGSREALLDAVVMRQGTVVLARTIELADAMLAAKRKPTVRGIVQIPAAVYTELLERDRGRGMSWLRVIGQLSLSHEAHFTELSEPATRRLIELLRRIYPDAPEKLIAESLTLALTTLIQLMGQLPRESPEDELRARVEALAEFVAGGLQGSVRAGVRALD
jgi:AcrR family transcriptional regulator